MKSCFDFEFSIPGEVVKNADQKAKKNHIYPLLPLGIVFDLMSSIRSREKANVSAKDAYVPIKGSVAKRRRETITSR
jgi:hypothetical protein